MNLSGIIKSGSIILLTCFLAILLTTFTLFALNQAGIISFTGVSGIVITYNLIINYLGYSLLFFFPILFGYFLFLTLLKSKLSLNPIQVLEEEENIQFNNKAVDMFITLFFGVGVLFTAWGLQNALVSAIGGMNKVEAGQLGAWGILQRLVNNGILIALWTTIVGGIGGYLMRLLKHFLIGKQLINFSNLLIDQDRDKLVDSLKEVLKEK